MFNSVLSNVYSNSRPGLSIIKVDIKNEYWSDRLPQVWDGLRKKIRDMETTLPPGAGRPKIGDDMLFNAYRPPLIIFLVIPFVAIGITAGMLLTQAPFGFIALLGAMSLSGMMIKNAVVLLDQVNQNPTEGMTRYNAVVEAAVSRLRPVANAAATTIFGMAPLLQDMFWFSISPAPPHRNTSSYNLPNAN